MQKNIAIGKFFLLGFRGTQIPLWMKEFAERFGLGGVILFDYDFQAKTYENNIVNPQQLRQLCEQIHVLPDSPLIYVDQEGGKVRRLKDKLGFTPLPSQWEMNQLSEEEQIRLLEPAYAEMASLGIDINLAPVIDLNINPENPDIGKVERSYSDNESEVIRNVSILNKIAQKHQVGLVLKHFPGLGGARVNSHLELTDLSDTLCEKQIQLFHQISQEIYGNSVLISHGLIQQWDPQFPCSISTIGVQKMREGNPDSILITDDLQMQGLQKRVNTLDACENALNSGIDLICIGNNMMDEEGLLLRYAETLTTKASESIELTEKLHQSSLRMKKLRQSLGR